MPLTAAYELCVVNWKSLHMLLTNKLQNISVWRASLCYYCMNVDYSLIHHFFFFYWGGGKNKDIRSKKEHTIWKGFNWCCLVFIKYMYLKNHIIIEITLGVSIGFIKTVVNFMDDIKEIHKTCIMHRLKR